MTNTPLPVAAAAIDGGALSLGGGLLALLRPALTALAADGVLAIASRAPSLHEDLAGWCRLERHTYLGCDTAADGTDRHLIARGALDGTTSDPPYPHAAPILVPAGPFGASTMLAAVPMPSHADPRSGFAPRGAFVEAGGPAYPFTILERDHVAPPEIGDLYDRAAPAQWDAARDIAWAAIRPLPQALDDAIVQIMAFLAENELAALYVPARFLPHIHPAYVEVAMVLAAQLADEARHIDAFLKRARVAAGRPPISAAVTAHSLHSLLEPTDFTEATFLLAVLGEGTFLDLLRFVEDHAPDEPTADLVRRARADEARHVHFGLAHVRHALSHDSTLFARLEAAVRRRAASLQGFGGVPHAVQDALTILAAGASDPRAVARGHEAFRELLEVMDTGRRKRLEHAGFTPEQAHILSDLHTPNFM